MSGFPARLGDATFPFRPPVDGDALRYIISKRVNRDIG